MENAQEKFADIVKKVEEMKRSGTADLSMDEDLSVAVMNLVSLEEHFFFTGEKTGKGEHFEFLREIREVRKELLGRLVDKKAHEGETWCITKHLLAASMRCMEVGTKLQGDGKQDDAKKFFDHAYKLYAMFWALRLKLLNPEGFKKVAAEEEALRHAQGKKPWTYQDIVEKLVDCCDE